MVYHSYDACGNVAHRLRPLPALLKAAYLSKRVLLIHWGEGLENFLEPPNKGGMNWRLPEYMMRALDKTPIVSRMEAIPELAKDPSTLIVAATINDRVFAEPFYNANLEPGDYPADVVFHDIYNVLFKPTAKLHERIAETHNTMGMPIGAYAAIHIDYGDDPKTDISKEVLKLKVENALNCVSNLRPGGPFLVAGQTYLISKYAVKYGKQHNVMVAARQVAHDSHTAPKDLWNAFLEIYFMANANCVAYGGNDAYGQLVRLFRSALL